jgi:hypothetical protein
MKFVWMKLKFLVFWLSVELLHVGRAFDVLELFNWQHLPGWSVLYLVGVIRCIVASNLRVVCGLNFRSPFVVQVFSQGGTVVSVLLIFLAEHGTQSRGSLKFLFCLSGFQSGKFNESLISSATFKKGQCGTCKFLLPLKIATCTIQIVLKLISGGQV